jgi:hypothetical protein
MIILRKYLKIDEQPLSFYGENASMYWKAMKKAWNMVCQVIEFLMER